MNSIISVFMYFRPVKTTKNNGPSITVTDEYYIQT